jgi:uncharacterized OsmC-like protein
MPDNAVIVRSSGSFRNEIEAGGHHFVADEPVSAGGNDEGPSPYAFLAAALGTCTSMTLHYYSQREKIPLEGVEVTITHDRLHAEDCAECTTKAGYIHQINVKLRLTGNLTHEQREHLLSIAKRCPLYKTLTSEIRIHETLAE